MGPHISLSSPSLLPPESFARSMPCPSPLRLCASRPPRLPTSPVHLLSIAPPYPARSPLWHHTMPSACLLPTMLLSRDWRSLLTIVRFNGGHTAHTPCSTPARAPPHTPLCSPELLPHNCVPRARDAPSCRYAHWYIRRFKLAIVLLATNWTKKLQRLWGTSLSVHFMGMGTS
jgi:hypothetical protein